MYVCSFFYLKSFITIARLDYYSKMLPYSERISLFKWFENHLLKKEANLEHLGRKGNTKNQICKGGGAEQHQAAESCRAPDRQAKKYQVKEMAGVTLTNTVIKSKTTSKNYMNPRPSNCQLEQHSHLML